MAVGMVTKLDLLAAFCESTLNAHKSGVKVHKRYRHQANPGTSRADRIQVMGDPAYYLEVRYSGPFESTVDVKGGEALQGTHRFVVQFIYEYEDDDNYDRSSARTFNEMVHQISDATPGLMIAINTTPVIGSGTDRCVLYHTMNDSQDVIPLSNRTPAHYWTCEVEVEG